MKTEQQVEKEDLKKKEEKMEEQFSRFFDVFKRIEINLPFVKALTQMPNYSKFLKDIMSKCDAPKPGGPLTTRQPAEYKWMSGYPTPLQKIGQSLLCTGSSTQMKHLHETCPKQSNITTMIQIWIKTASWANTIISIKKNISAISHSSKS